jgi:CubicO group peptidase (beta-lactamase class C family)
MTKPMVTTALMQMVEEGRLQVSDPVSKFLPSLGAMKVGTEVTGADGLPVLRLSDPARQMTVQDLMRHWSGALPAMIQSSSAACTMVRNCMRRSRVSAAFACTM